MTQASTSVHHAMLQAWLDPLGDAFQYLDRGDVLRCELVSRAMHKRIQERKVWRWTFQTHAAAHHWTVPLRPPNDWKHYMHQYETERALRVTPIDGAPFVYNWLWRLPTSLYTLAHLQRMSSVAFECGVGDDQSSMLTWRLVAQRIHEGGVDKIGVFVQQLDSCLCSFDMALMNTADAEAYTEVHDTLRHVLKPFYSNHYGTTSGWFFAQSDYPADLDPVVRVQMAVHPFAIDLSDGSVAKPSDDPPEVVLGDVWASIQSPAVSMTNKKSLISVVGDYARKLSLEERKRCQSRDGCVDLMVDLLNNDSEPALRSAVCSCMWNLIDTSSFGFGEDTLLRVCQSVEKLLTSVSETKESTANNAHFICVATGVLWNIPSRPSHCQILTACPEIFTALRRLSTPLNNALEKCVFPAVHVLTMMTGMGYLGTEYLEDIEAGTDAICDILSRANGQGDVALGVALTARDVADFFLPMLRCGKFVCIRFAYVAIMHQYYGAEAAAEAQRHRMPAPPQ